MPNWNQILDETRNAGGTQDIFRRRYLKDVYNLTKRNVILYYSGWLQNRSVHNSPELEINEEDKNGFMTVIHKLKRDRGLDLILHTPGGEMAVVESIVGYLRSMFGTNIRAIVPQIAMSGGTVIACACKEIIMGKHSSLGPIDPHFSGISAHGIVEEFNRAKKEVKKDGTTVPIWQQILSRYQPAFIGDCEKAIEWCNELTGNFLQTGMFAETDSSLRVKTVSAVVDSLGDHAITKSHSRRLSIDQCREIGLEIVPLEKDPKLQDAVLSLHHACMLTFSTTPALKIIENHLGAAFIKIDQGV